MLARACVLAALAALVSAGWCVAEEAATAVAPPAKTTVNSAAKPEIDPTADQHVEALRLSHALAQWGRANKSAAALATAASIADGVPTQPMEGVTRTSEGGIDAPEKAAVPSTSADLYKEAKAIAQGEAAIAMVDTIEKSGVRTKGPIGGTRVTNETVKALGTDRYALVLRGNEPWYVTVSGDGDTDLDLYVFDDNGNLVASDDDYTDECRCAGVPRYTGKFWFVVVNRGRVYNNYLIMVQ